MLDHAKFFYLYLNTKRFLAPWIIPNRFKLIDLNRKITKFQNILNECFSIYAFMYFINNLDFTVAQFNEIKIRLCMFL